MSAALRLCEALNRGDLELPDHDGALEMLARLLRPILNPTPYESRCASGAETHSTPTPTPSRQDQTAGCAVPAGGA